jgi:hypothetical protein
MTNKNLEWNQFEQILKFITYNYDKDDFYATIPDNHVIIGGKNKGYTISKLRLYQNARDTTIQIDNVVFYCELLTRNTDNSVLLRVEYKDDIDEPKIKKIQQTRLIKYIEAMLLGFDKYGKQYEDNPKEFFEDDLKIYDGFGNDAW